MAGILFIPLGTKPLSSGLLICNTNTGELFEIIKEDEYRLKMKSLSQNSIVTMLSNQMSPENWVICSVE